MLKGEFREDRETNIRKIKKVKMKGNGRVNRR